MLKFVLKIDTETPTYWGFFREYIYETIKNLMFFHISIIISTVRKWDILKMDLLMNYWAVIMLSLPVYVFVTMVITSELKRRWGIPK